MNALEVYALLNKKLKGVISGVESTKIIDNTIYWTFTDGTSEQMTFPTPTSIQDVFISDDNHLYCSLTTGTLIDAGALPTSNIEISKATGNILVQKEDGLYVPSAEISIDDSLDYNTAGELGVKESFVSETIENNNTISTTDIERLF